MLEATQDAAGVVPVGMDPPTTCRWPYVLLGILVVSFVLDLVFFTGYYASDDNSSYLSATESLLDNGALPSESKTGQTRLPLIGWNVLIATLFGYDVQLIAASYIVFHQLLNLLTFLLARRMFGSIVGLLATYCVASFPAMIIYSTLISPDIPQSCFIVLSLLVFMIASECSDRNPRRLYLLLLCTGASLGGAYMCKESGLVLLPFYALAVFFGTTRQSLRARITACMAFFLGFAIVFALESVALSLLTGKPILRIGWVFDEESGTGSTWKEYRHGFYPWERLAWFSQRCLRDVMFPLYYRVLFIIGLVTYLFLPRRRPVALLLPAYYFAYLLWGSVSIKQYLPISIQERYYLPLVPFLAIIGSFAAVSLFELLPRRRLPWWVNRCLGAVIVCAVVIPPVFGIGGASLKAGRMYRSELVGNTTRAIRYAARDEAATIVLSRRLYALARPVLLSEKPDNLVDAGSLSAREVADLLDRKRFLYIQEDVSEPANAAPKRQSPMDALMLTLPCGVRKGADTGDSLSKRPIRYWSIGPGCPDLIRGPGYELIVRRLGSFTAPHSRLEGIWQVLASPPVARGYDSKPVLLSEIEVCPPRARPVSDTRPSRDLAPKIRKPGSYGRLKYFGNWKVWASRDIDYRIRAGSEGEPTLTVAESGAEFLQLLPANDLLCEFRFDPDALFHIDVGAEVVGSVKVELRLTSYGDLKTNRSLASREMVLLSGVNRISLRGGTSPLYLRPVFRISGKGAFTLKSLAMGREG
ncbi:MAG: glycosyltransferase family 39 protein [Phycisphaerae bacterium]|nr:glycosyltransferase family 39 protein [Phycisphaerae bacterium]